MKVIVEKLIQVEQEIAQEKGPFALFALFLREDAPDLWDLVVAAPWMVGRKRQAMEYIAGKLKEHLEPHELMRLSRIVVLDLDAPDLKALQRTAHVEHGSVEVQNSFLFGLPIQHAYIITAQRQTADKNDSEGTDR